MKVSIVLEQLSVRCRMIGTYPGIVPDVSLIQGERKHGNVEVASVLDNCQDLTISPVLGKFYCLNGETGVAEEGRSKYASLDHKGTMVNMARVIRAMAMLASVIISGLVSLRIG